MAWWCKLRIAPVMNAPAPASCTHWPSDCDGEVVIDPPQFSGSHFINGQSSKLLNSGLCSFGSGAESAGACQPRATPWVVGIDRCALQGRRNPPPLQGGRAISGTFPGRCPG